MTAKVKIEAVSFVPGKELVMPLARERCAPERSSCERPSDAYKLDHMLYAYMGSLTGGISPTSIVLARLDG